MKYQLQCWDAEEAKGKINDYPYALVYELSTVYFGETKDMGDLDWDECTDARFFSESEELHFFLKDDQWRVVQVTDQATGTGANGGTGADHIDYIYRLTGLFSGVGHSVKVRKYLSEDDDGQKFVELTRLAGIER